MRAWLYLLIGFCLISQTPAAAAVYGEPLQLDQTTTVSELLSNGDDYIGQRVKVRGLIVDVCQKRGCWMYVAGDKPFEKIRIKVKDGDIVFPLEARGRTAVVEGLLEKFELSREEVIARKKHHAEEQGESFDPATVTSGETFFQIRGLGARIEGL